MFFVRSQEIRLRCARYCSCAYYIDDIQGIDTGSKRIAGEYIDVVRARTVPRQHGAGFAGCSEVMVLNEQL